MILLLRVALFMAPMSTASSPNEHYMAHASSNSNPSHVTAFIQPSPECWMGAMKALQQLDHDADIHDDEQPTQPSLGSLVCTNMSHDHKKTLALELTRCQIQDLGRSLFEENDAKCSRPLTSSQQLHSCLGSMTNAGIHAYSLFFTHVHQSCTRLTQEQLMQASQVATAKLHSMLNRQSELWQSQQEEHTQVLERLWNKAEAREREIQVLTQNVVEKMKPLLGMESIISIATNGVTWLASLFYMFCCVNVIWLLTRHDGTRQRMFRLAFTEALLEFGMHWMVTQGLIGDEERVYGISVLRHWTLVCHCVLYLVGLILLLIQKKTKPEQQQQDMNETMVEIRHLIANSERTHNVVEQLKPTVEVVAPTPLLPRPIGRNPLVANRASSSNQVSLPPMYQELVPSHELDSTVPTPTREITEQDYAAAALYESLRLVMASQQQAPMPLPPQPVRIVGSPQESPPPQQQTIDTVQVVHDQPPLSKDPKKRPWEYESDDEEEDDLGEPERKKARNDSPSD